MELNLDSPVQYLPRVGPILAAKLAKLGIYSLEDLLFYIPFRYNDFSLTRPISQIRADETVTVKGTIQSFRNVFTKTGKKFQQMELGDDSGKLTVVWFNQPYLSKIMKAGYSINLAGSTGWFGNKMVLSSPEYEIIMGAGDEVSLHTGRLVPVYPETAGITSKWLRGRIAFAINKCKDKLLEYLPDSIIKSQHLADLRWAIEQIHFPKNKQNILTAYDRLAFEELFMLQLSASEQKITWQNEHRSQKMLIKNEFEDQFIRSLPFKLTEDQLSCIVEITQDLSREIPMNRMLEGDVGSGKTVVAALAVFLIYQNRLKSILMAPTQILASQHYQTLTSLLNPFGINVQLVTGGSSQKFNNQADVYVGTHALLSEKINFKNVGLIIIDEQQRFGVMQRQLLSNKANAGLSPHFLTMTATPIPRTVARTIYGNLDLSVIKEMPTGRKMVKTWVVPQEKRNDAYRWIEKQISKNNSQTFIVCPLIEESENLVSIKAVTSEYERLKNDIFPGLKLGLLHGRLKTTQKNEVLQKFRDGKIQILVATPVIEVGIDIPNATIMLIEASERFGLAQLHQLRGRVGRSDKESYCLLFTQNDNPKILNRLKYLESVHNGPELAEIDLTLRGPGEIFGTMQHGVPLLKIAKMTDLPLVNRAQTEVKRLIDEDRTLSRFPLLRAKLKKGKIENVGD